MPANLTPQYRKAEQAYRQATNPQEELDCLEIMLREIPKHKGTDKLQSDLKQKISKVKKDISDGAKKTTNDAQSGFKIPHQGAGRAVLIGPPNSGKSQFLTAVTRATPEVADYPFTTRDPIPGMMAFEDVMIQVIDTPPITNDVMDQNMVNLVRGADIVLLFIDLGNDDCAEDISAVMDRFSEGKTRLADETYLDEEDIGRSYTRTYAIYNKTDNSDSAGRREWIDEVCPIPFKSFNISATTGAGLDEVCDAVFRALDVVRVYTKMPTQKEADFDKPFTIKRGESLMELAQLIHKDVAESFKFAKVWGTNVHDGTQVKGDYVPADKDIVEIHC